MMPMSYSRMSCFEQCGTKFEHLYVLKDVTDPGNIHTMFGTRVHEALEKYGRDGVPLTPESVQYAPLVDTLLARPGEKYFEYQMAIRRDRTVCDWLDPDVWVRGIADIAIVNGKTAFVGDWKTGKVKDNPTQIKLFACMVLEHFPEVETVTTAFIWLAHGDITKDRFYRNHLDDMWASLEPRFDAVQDAVDLGVFKSSPSGLCNWCPAKDLCPDKKRR